jgi:hypothetical protein
MTTTDPIDLEREARDAIANLESIQRELGAITKDDPRRDGLKADLAAALDRVRSTKDAVKEMNARRNFAGLGSPLHQACTARLAPEVVAVIELEAMAILDERGRLAAERRAARAAAAPTIATPPALPAPAPLPPTPAPRTTVTRHGPALAPEVYRMLRRGAA